MIFLKKEIDCFFKVLYSCKDSQALTCIKIIGMFFSFVEIKIPCHRFRLHIFRNKISL